MLKIVTILFLFWQSSAWGCWDYDKKDGENFKACKAAAEGGDKDAQQIISFMYSLGASGVDQDPDEALKWYQRAAEQGDSISQVNLGVLYASGNQIPMDRVKAYMWLHIAAKAGSVEGKEFRDTVAVAMSKAEISRAQKLAKDWLSQR